MIHKIHSDIQCIIRKMCEVCIFFKSISRRRVLCFSEDFFCRCFTRYTQRHKHGFCCCLYAHVSICKHKVYIRVISVCDHPLTINSTTICVQSSAPGRCVKKKRRPIRLFLFFRFRSRNLNSFFVVYHFFNKHVC